MIVVNWVYRGQAEKEFRVEVEAIGHVRHKNLVRLLGYCVEGVHRLDSFTFSIDYLNPLLITLPCCQIKYSTVVPVLLCSTPNLFICNSLCCSLKVQYQ